MPVLEELQFGRIDKCHALQKRMNIQIRPVDAVAATGNFPIALLLLGSTEKSRIPGEKHTDGSSIHQ
jgi:hypothetical protein